MPDERWNDSGPECPYCGNVETTDEAYYFDEDMTEVECGSCERTYRCRYYRRDSWTSNPLPEGDAGNG